MKQKVLKKLGLLALSSIMVAPNVLSGEILENNSKPIGNEKAYPKLSTKDAGKNPKKESTVKAKSGSGFFGKLFKIVGGVVVLNETHDLIRTLFGNPWFCFGMARRLFKQQQPVLISLTSCVLADWEKTGMLISYFQRINCDEIHKNQTEIPLGNSESDTPTKPVFQGVLTPMSEHDIEDQTKAGEQFAENHPHLALLILKRFDAMLAMGIDKLTEFVDSKLTEFVDSSN